MKRFSDVKMGAFNTIVLILVSSALVACERPETTPDQAPGFAAPVAVEVEPDEEDQQREESASADEDEDEVADVDKDWELGDREQFLYDIATGAVSMEEALTTEDGVVWVVNMEDPNGDGDLESIPLRRRLSPRAARFGELLCGEGLEPFWEALPAMFEERFEVARDHESFLPQCAEDYCTIESLGEYYAFIRLEFDESDRIRAALFYTRDGTIMQEVLDDFQDEAFALRDEALSERCE